METYMNKMAITEGQITELRNEIRSLKDVINDYYLAYDSFQSEASGTNFKRMTHARDMMFSLALEEDGTFMPPIEGYDDPEK
jgi:lipopolysaccharide biosynthesis glycosyltransferase